MEQVERIIKNHLQKWGVPPTPKQIITIIAKDDLRNLTIKVDL